MTNTNTSSAAAQALQLLITAAQAGDNGALLKLCSDFKPLLSSEARREMFYNSLGKDAEGIAVLAFIELVLKYSGTDYVNWPGYARCRVHFALFDAMQKQGRIWENEIAVNTDSEEGTALLDEAGLQQGLPDDIAQLLLSLEVRQALKRLTAEQQQIILDASANCISFQRDLVAQQNSDAVDALKEKGVEFIDLDKAELQAKVEPVYEKYADKLPADIMEKIRNP